MIHVLIMLRVGVGGMDALRTYEARVLPFLVEHGGKLLSAFEPEDAEPHGTPDEVHLLSFPNAEALRSFREDPRVLALADERNSAIAETIVHVSRRIVDYEI